MRRSRSLRLFTLSIGMFFGVFCLVFAQSQIVGAAPSDQCPNKVENKKCVAEVNKKCTSTVLERKDDCARNIAKDYKDKKPGDSTSTGGSSSISLGEAGKYQCGKKDGKKGAVVNTKFNFGCLGPKYPGASVNPILDLVFSIIRFVSAGVGLIVVGSIIYAGILYSSSQGNPEQTQAAKNRIQNSVIGLVVYIFSFALVQYLVPGGLFK